MVHDEIPYGRVVRAVVIGSAPSPNLVFGALQPILYLGITVDIKAVSITRKTESKNFPSTNQYGENSALLKGT
jgi:hypothetical protein